MPSNPFWTNAAIDILLVIYVLDCAFMGLVIMMQRSKQEGLGAAFGGGFTESIWGAQTSQVLVKSTTIAAIIFFCCSIVLARLYSHRASLTHQTSNVQMELEKAATPTPGATNAAPAVVPAPSASGPTNAPAASITPATPAAPAPVKPASTPAKGPQ